MDALFKRRSIRRFKERSVDNDKVRMLLKAGFAAPSARNRQPWNFLVINERNILNRIPDVHPYASMIKEAPMAILVMGDMRDQEMEGYMAQDCSAATENILIEAAALGLGSVWLGVYPREERMDSIRELFSIPPHLMPFSLIVIGYANESKKPNDRYIEDRVFFNRIDKER